MGLKTLGYDRLEFSRIQPKKGPTMRASLCILILTRHVAALLLLSQFIVVLPAWSASPPGAEGFELCEVRPAVTNLRDGPGTQYETIEQLGRGQRVYVSSVYDGWAEVRTDDGWQDGWIRADLLTVIDPNGSLPSDANSPWLRPMEDFWADNEEMLLFGGLGLLLVVVAVVIVLSVVLYFLPSIIASRRGHHNAGAIFVLNLLLGWTWLGWVAVLAWALTAVDESKKKFIQVRSG